MIMISKAEDYEYILIEEIGKECLPIYYKYNDLFILEIEKHEVYKIEDNNIIVGFIVFKYHKNENRVHIMSIGVLEEFRRKSFGSLFIEFIKKNYKSNITLYVQISNENAINFYKKNNFIIEKKITNYYKTLEVKDAYLMKFKLN